MAFTEHRAGELVYDTSGVLTGAGGVRCAFTTRFGGVSPAPFDTLNFSEAHGDSRANVLENARRLGEAAGIPMARAAACRQVHSGLVRFVQEEHAGRFAWEARPWEADAMLTDVPDLPLAVFSADCCTILLYDPTCRCVGAVHAGWRGTADGLVLKALVAMMSVYGADPMTIRAAIGPSIGACCFETDGDVPAAMSRALKESAEPYITRNGDKYHVDLKAINHLWLLRGGLDPAHVEVHPDCTACRTDRYWSHRRMGVRRGLQLAVVSLEAAP